MKLKDVRRKADEFVDQSEGNFHHMMQFFHDRHVVLYLHETPKPEHTVVLDFRWLIDNVLKKVVTIVSDNDKEGFKEEWKKLQGQGLLLPKLAKHIWKDFEQTTIDDFYNILEKLSLACRWTKDGSEVGMLIKFLIQMKAKMEHLRNITCSSH